MTSNILTRRRVAAWLGATMLFAVALFWASVTFSAPRSRRETPEPARRGHLVEPDAAFLTDAGVDRVAGAPRE